MINNIKQIKSLLNFEKKGDFYMLYVMKRKKDQPEMEKDQHQSVRTIKSYSISSLEYLDKRYDEIKQLCELFKARAYIHVQKQNHHDVALEMIPEIIKRIQSGQIEQQHVFDSVVGKLKTYEKRWVVDVDTKDSKEVLAVQQWIDHCLPHGEDKIITTIPTKNGVHLITKRFDVMEFKKQYPGVDIQKKNPTLLYYPDSLDKKSEIDIQLGDSIEFDNGQRIVRGGVVAIISDTVHIKYDTKKTIPLSKKDLKTLGVKINKNKFGLHNIKSYI